MGKIRLGLILVAFFFQQIVALEFPANGTYLLGIQIYQMHVKSVVRNRYAQTTVTSKMINTGRLANEASFSLVLPESAFISAFIMEVDGTNYTAYVKEKDEAKNTFQEAISTGTGAAHVAVSVRDSNRITVSVNVEALKKAVFYLSYEELLTRQNGLYELVINLFPRQSVHDLSVEVEINESKKITNLTSPPLRPGNQIYIKSYDLNHGALKKTINDNRAVVGFSPSVARQKRFGNILGIEQGQGFAGQFIVQYDVERDPEGGQVLVKDGYFAHFFAPSSLTRLPKHVVFVLDTSDSMKYGEKLQQLKKSMYGILDQLNPDDIFHLIEFASNVKLWVLEDSPYYFEYTVKNIQKIMSNFDLHKTCSANSENIKRAKAAISKFIPYGATDIYSALRIGLYLVELTMSLKKDTISHQPMLIFLTDGEPNARVNSAENILKEITTKFNTGLRKTPIFALSLGSNTDRDFLEKLSLSNAGLPKHIYEESDADLQIEKFYRDISSPLLANVAFKYEPSIKNLTKTQFPLHFKDTELVTAGHYGVRNINQSVVEAWNGKDLTFQPTIQQSVSSVERLWAYLTVKQLLEKKQLTDEEQQERKRKAIDLSLRYSFVTPLTSLVVVKPNITSVINIEIAKGYATKVPTKNPNTTSNTGNAYGAYAPAINYGLPLKSLVDSNRMLNLKNGKFKLYKLGEKETISDSVSCSNSILNSDGHCRLLHSCVTDGLSMLYDDYIDHFCVLRNDYAGICCPDSWFENQ